MRFPFRALPQAVVASLFAFSSLFAQKANDRDLRVLSRKSDSLLSRLAQDNGPGCALGVVEGGRPLLFAGRGLADLSYEMPIRSTTRFAIASISKQFTALATWMLIREGAIGADDDVRKYLPALPVYGATITIRQLLLQTSGLRDAWNLTAMGGRWYEDPVTQTDLLAMTYRQRGVNFLPGTRYEYSNTNYLLLAEVIQKVTGRSLESFAEERIFRPLGMLHTSYVRDHSATIPDFATSYIEAPNGGFRAFRSNWDAVGAGGIVSTVEDLARWEANWITPVVGGGGLLDSMLVEGRSSSGAPNGYASGLFIDRVAGIPVVRHGGSSVGYRGEIVRFPQQRLSVIALCNWPSNPRPAQLVDQIALLFVSPSAVVSTTLKGSSTDTIAIAENVFANVAGSYWDPETGIIREMVWRRGRAAYVISATARAWLTALSPRQFRFGQTELSVEGEAPNRILVVRPPSGPVERYMEVQRAAPDEKALAQYAGEYVSDEIAGALYTFTPDSGGLRLGRKIGDEQLAPTATDSFAGGDVRVWFIRDRRGNITGVDVSDGRLRRIPFKRRAQ